MHSKWLSYCAPVQTADQTTCSRCKATWDTNDPAVTGCMAPIFAGDEARRHQRHRRIISSVALGVILLMFAFSLWFITYGRGRPAALFDATQLPIRGLVAPPPNFTPMPREQLPPVIKDVMK